MEELIQKLQSEHGLSAEQSHGILNTVVTFVKEKFPMVGGAIDNLFHTGAGSSAPVNPAGTQASFAKDRLGGMFGAEKKA